MALRKQPDRRVKKKRKVEMPENLEIAKRKRELEEPRNFDIVGNLLCNYGMTGENLVRDIFSYMDVSSLQGGHLVCKTWNIFLTNDRKLWMGILRQTRPYFELLSKQLVFKMKTLPVSFDAERISLESYCDFVEESEDFCSQNIIKIFKRIQMIHIGLQDVIQDSPDYEVFQKEFIGQKLAREVLLQMNKAKMEKQQQPKFSPGDFDFKSSFAWLLENAISVIECRQEMEFLEEMKKNNQILINNDENSYEQQIKKGLEVREELLLIGIQITVRDSCVDV